MNWKLKAKDRVWFISMSKNGTPFLQDATVVSIHYKNVMNPLVKVTYLTLDGTSPKLVSPATLYKSHHEARSVLIQDCARKIRNLADVIRSNSTIMTGE